MKQFITEHLKSSLLLLKRLLLGVLLLFSGVTFRGDTPAKIFKISVMASGVVLLNGKQTSLADLEKTLNAVRSTSAMVWYYRESATSEAPPVAKQIMDLVAKNRLAISFSTRPDFSDYVDEKGVSRPRDRVNAGDAINPRMPDVDTVPDIDRVFADARERAAAQAKPRVLVVVGPDRKLVVFPEPENAPASATAAVEKLVPSSVKRNIAVIGYTGFARASSVSISPRDANNAIPFFGMLLGLTHIGHSVWVFEGHPGAIAAGCRNADLLIVDGGMEPFLAKGWVEEAAKVMRHRNILMHDRATYQLRVVRQASQ